MSKTGGRLWAALVVLACSVGPVLVAPARATTEAVAESASASAAAHRKTERDRIAREREALTARRQQEEAVCYQRFAVEDCLRGVRAKARETHDRLRAQEIELNDAERREKAAERLRAIEGMVPHPLNRPKGCPFNTRCAEARAGLCDQVDPRNLELAPGHFAACHMRDPAIVGDAAGVSA